MAFSPNFGSVPERCVARCQPSTSQLFWEQTSKFFFSQRPTYEGCVAARVSTAHFPHLLGANLTLNATLPLRNYYLSTHVSQCTSITGHMYHNAHASQYTCITMHIYHNTHVSQCTCIAIHVYHKAHASQYMCITIHMYFID